MKLFTYGTLMDTLIQQILFDCILPVRDATLHGWRLHETPSGFYFIKPAIGCSVTGKVLDVTAHQIFMMDKWEGVPEYLRKKVMVTLNNGELQPTWVYCRPDGKDKPCISNGIANFPYHQIIQGICEFKMAFERYYGSKNVRKIII